MKKILATTLILALLFSFAACGKKTQKTDNSETTPSPTDVVVSSENEIANDVSENSDVENIVDTLSESVVTSIPSSNSVSSSSSKISSSAHQSSTVESSASDTTNSSSSITNEPSQDEQYEQPDEPSVLQRNFDSINELTTWLKSDKVLPKDEAIFYEVSKTYEKTGLLVPKISVEPSSILMYCQRNTSNLNAVAYYYKSVSDDLPIVEIQAFQLSDAEKAHKSKGIVDYYKNVDKNVFDKEIVKGDNTYIYKEGTLSFDSQNFECVETTITSKYLNEITYAVYCGDFRLSISYQVKSDKSKDTFLDFFKQFSFEKVSIK